MRKEELTYSLEDFKDPTNLTKWVRWLSYFGILVSLFALVAGLIEHEYYQSLKLDLFETEELANQAEDSKDNLMGVVAIFQMFVLIQLVAFFLWVYRLNYNTHALGAQMRFTPKWSVIWFFIPIMSLWKGYQVLKDIWVTNQPEDVSQSGKKVKARFIGWFWLFWIWSTFLSTRVATYSLFANGELDKLYRLNLIELASSLIDIPCYIFTLILLKKFFNSHTLYFSLKAKDYEKRMAKLSPEERDLRSQSKWTKRALLTLLVICIVLGFFALLWFFFGDQE